MRNWVITASAGFLLNATSAFACLEARGVMWTFGGLILVTILIPAVSFFVFKRWYTAREFRFPKVTALASAVVVFVCMIPILGATGQRVPKALACPGLSLDGYYFVK